MNEKAAKRFGRSNEWAKHLRPFGKRKAAKKVRKLKERT